MICDFLFFLFEFMFSFFDGEMQMHECWLVDWLGDFYILKG